MPEAAYQECRYPRCPNYAVDQGYCVTHASDAARQRRYGNLSPSNSRFRTLRQSFLLRHAICNVCRSEPGIVLDHVVPHRGVPALYWNQANWQALCVRCHGVKTARESWDRGNRRFPRPGLQNFMPPQNF